MRRAGASPRRQLAAASSNTTPRGAPSLRTARTRQARRNSGSPTPCIARRELTADDPAAAMPPAYRPTALKGSPPLSEPTSRDSESDDDDDDDLLPDLLQQDPGHDPTDKDTDPNLLGTGKYKAPIRLPCLAGARPRRIHRDSGLDAPPPQPSPLRTPPPPQPSHARTPKPSSGKGITRLACLTGARPQRVRTPAPDQPTVPPATPSSGKGIARLACLVGARPQRVRTPAPDQPTVLLTTPVTPPPTSSPPSTPTTSPIAGPQLPAPKRLFPHPPSPAGDSRAEATKHSSSGSTPTLEDATPPRPAPTPRLSPDPLQDPTSSSSSSCSLPPVLSLPLLSVLLLLALCAAAVRHLSVTSVARQLANAFLQLLPPLLVVCAPARATLFVVAAGPRCRMRERPPRLRDKLASEGGGEARLARQQPSPQRLASALVRVYLDLGLAWSPCGYGSV